MGLETFLVNSRVRSRHVPAQLKEIETGINAFQAGVDNGRHVPAQLKEIETISMFAAADANEEAK